MYNSLLTLFFGKLRSPWSGPFTVKEVKPYGAITLIRKEGNEFTVNGQRVKYYWAKALIPKVNEQRVKYLRLKVKLKT